MVYVPRKPRTTKYVRKGSKGVRTSTYTKRKRTASTYRGRQATIAKMIRSVGETKYKGFKIIDDAPSSIQTGAQTFFNGYDFGNTTDQTGFVTLAATLFPTDILNGASYNTREGMHMYLCKTTAKLRVAMNPFDNQNMSQTQLGKSFGTFRVIICRQRREFTQTGYLAAVNQTLFRDENGGYFGHSTSGITINDLTMAPVNLKNFELFKDVKFQLSPPAMFVAHDSQNDAGYSGPSGKYPHMKDIDFTITHNKKCEYNNTSNEPENYNSHYYVIVYGGSPTREGSVNNWETTIRGTTTALDN